MPRLNLCAAKRYTFGLLLPLFALVAATPDANAESIIKQPGRQPRYVLELEPHLLVGLGDAPTLDRNTDAGYGVGGRLSIPVVPEGFIKSINDSIAVGVGLDYMHYSGRTQWGACTRWRPGPAGTSICVETTGTGGSANLWIVPVVLQWNFWLTDKFSVFGEPGVAVTSHSGDGLGFAPFVIWAGGRYHFNQTMALTVRLGYPTFSAGLSFLL
jgi:hypothetical protein